VAEVYYPKVRVSVCGCVCVCVCVYTVLCKRSAKLVWQNTISGLDPVRERGNSSCVEGAVYIGGKTSFKYNSQKPLRKRISRAKYIFVYNIHRMILLSVNNRSLGNFFFFTIFLVVECTAFFFYYLFFFLNIMTIYVFNSMFLSRIFFLRISMLMHFHSG